MYSRNSVTTTDLGPHGSSYGDRYFGSHWDWKVDEQRLSRDALVVRPQVAVVLDHLIVHVPRRTLAPHLLL